MKLKAPEKFKKHDFEKGKYRCLLCGSDNRMKCGTTTDGGLAYCSATPSGRTDSWGRYLHIMKETTNTTSTALGKSEETAIHHKKAVSESLHKAYSALLTLQKLDEAHANDLLNQRGLCDEQIAKNLYASVPNYSDRFRIAKELGTKIDLEGVPGFYNENGNWCLHMTLPGFYVPYRDENGQIVGLQIRLDEPRDNKYVWLSTYGKEGGTSSGSPLHFVNPDIAHKSGILYLTEGALKADIIGSRMHVGVVATAGVNASNPETVFNSILKVFPNIKQFIIAYDMDWKTNVHVAGALNKLLKTFRKKDSVRTIVATWDLARGKGLDDLMLCEGFSETDIEHTDVSNFQLECLDNDVVESTSQADSEDSYQSCEEFDVLDEQFIEDKICERDKGTNELGKLWRDFSTQQFPLAERTMFGLGRGELGLLIASTNLGKSTLILNLALSATSGRPFEPLFDAGHVARRVMYVDGEATKAELQGDLHTMVRCLSERECRKVGDNFIVVCEAEIDGLPLNCSDEEHLAKLLKVAEQFRPDLIVIDTLSALFELDDENDNALVMKQVIQPLKTLARKTNSSVILLHHSGKFNEGFSPQKAYWGRGASVFGASARAVFTLDKSKLPDGRVRLTCAKVKGRAFQPTVLELDFESRWFSAGSDEKDVSKNEEKDNYQKMVDCVTEVRKSLSRKTLHMLLEKRGIQISYATVGRYIKLAKEKGDLGGKFGQIEPINMSVVEPEIELELKE